MSDPLKARHTDPETSDAGVKRVRKQRNLVFGAAEDLRVFTDSGLRDSIKDIYGVTLDRGVVARVRLLLERDGLIRRLPDKQDGQLVFKLSFDGLMTARGSSIQ